ncbi:MAG: NTF2 fold immunity protein [Paludibacter sp.]|nr:NTF2 fold immunity protein [Paludibacter sp.]
MKTKLLIVICILATTVIFGASIKKRNYYLKAQSGYIPKDGFVPDKITAIRIAIAVWLPIYGDAIYKEKPFDAVLKNGIWIVEGSLPKGFLGGVAVIKIQKKDGKVLSVFHGK